MNGISKFMKSGDEFLNQYIKLYLCKSSGLDLLIGPIYNKSIDKINNIIYYIIKFIGSDCFTKQKDEIDNDIKNTFINNEQIVLFYN